MKTATFIFILKAVSLPIYFDDGVINIYHDLDQIFRNTWEEKDQCSNRKLYIEEKKKIGKDNKLELYALTDNLFIDFNITDFWSRRSAEKIYSVVEVIYFDEDKHFLKAANSGKIRKYLVFAGDIEYINIFSDQILVEFFTQYLEIYHKVRYLLKIAMGKFEQDKRFNDSCFDK